MPVLLNVVAPVFGILGLGFLAARLRLLDPPGIRGLVLFVFNFAIPVLLFRSLAEMALPAVIPWAFLAAFYTGALTAYAAGMALARWGYGRPLQEQAIWGMGAGFSNTVLLGIPIVLTGLGPEASLPLFLIIGFHSAVLMPVTVALLHLKVGEGADGREQAVTVVREIVRNPIVMGLALGLLANLAGVTLPGPLDRMAELLGAAAVPCALFAMGASLAAYPAGGDTPPALALASLKLVVHPLVVWLLVGPLLGLEGIWLSTAVVVAAMPTGVNVYLFAARYDAAPSVAARTVLLASALSVVTVSVLLVVLA
ncbi:MAG TPA: AEC family transporter [Longimicrobiales bacterium]|nr:AEC family transporter [Longimicrobiales bacterium]